MWGDMGSTRTVGLLVASDSLPHAGCVHGARATVEYVLHRPSPWLGLGLGLGLALTLTLTLTLTVTLTLTLTVTLTVTLTLTR